MGWWVGDLDDYGIYVACQFLFLLLILLRISGLWISGSIGLTSAFCIAVTCFCVWSLDRL